MKLMPVTDLPEKGGHREYLKAGRRALEEFKELPDKVVLATFEPDEYLTPYSAVAIMNKIIERENLNMMALMRYGQVYLVKFY